MKAFVKDTYAVPVEVTVYQTEVPTPQGQLALILIEKFGLIAGAPDGESSDGRAKGKLLEPEAVVERAFTLAELTFQRLRRENLLLQIPDLAEEVAKAKAAKAEAAERTRA